MPTKDSQRPRAQPSSDMLIVRNRPSNPQDPVKASLVSKDDVNVVQYARRNPDTPVVVSTEFGERKTTAGEFIKQIQGSKSAQALEYRVPVTTFQYGGSVAFAIPKSIEKAMNLGSSKCLYCRFDKEVGLIFEKDERVSDEVVVPLHNGSSSIMVIIPKEFRDQMGIEVKTPLQLYIRKDASCLFLQTFSNDILELLRE